MNLLLAIVLLFAQQPAQSTCADAACYRAVVTAKYPGAHDESLKMGTTIGHYIAWQYPNYTPHPGEFPRHLSSGLQKDEAAAWKSAYERLMNGEIYYARPASVDCSMLSTSCTFTIAHTYTSDEGNTIHYDKAEIVQAKTIDYKAEVVKKYPNAKVESEIPYGVGKATVYYISYQPAQGGNKVVLSTDESSEGAAWKMAYLRMPAR